MNHPETENESIRELLGKDHRQIDEIFSGLLRDLRMAMEGRPLSIDSLRSQWKMFDQRLERHIRWEEDLLFPAVEELQPELKNGPGHVMRLEHEDIRRLKTSIAQRLATAVPSPEALKRAADELNEMFSILKDHNMKEEAVYYPMADEMCPPAKIAELVRKFIAS